jgi:hypothetical protein
MASAKKRCGHPGELGQDRDHVGQVSEQAGPEGGPRGPVAQWQVPGIAQHEVGVFGAAVVARRVPFAEAGRTGGFTLHLRTVR